MLWGSSTWLWCWMDANWSIRVLSWINNESHNIIWIPSPVWDVLLFIPLTMFLYYKSGHCIGANQDCLKQGEGYQLTQNYVIMTISVFICQMPLIWLQQTLNSVTCFSRVRNCEGLDGRGGTTYHARFAPVLAIHMRLVPILVPSEDVTCPMFPPFIRTIQALRVKPPNQVNVYMDNYHKFVHCGINIHLFIFEKLFILQSITSAVLIILQFSNVTMVPHSEFKLENAVVLVLHKVEQFLHYGSVYILHEQDHKIHWLCWVGNKIIAVMRNKFNHQRTALL